MRGTIISDHRGKEEGRGAQVFLKGRGGGQVPLKGRPVEKASLLAGAFLICTETPFLLCYIRAFVHKGHSGVKGGAKEGGGGWVALELS